MKNQVPVNYWTESAQPLTSLIFVIPMLLIYEGGMLVLGPGDMRNGADVWLRSLLDLLGFGQYFLLPVLTCGILLAWHHLLQQRWRLEPGVLSVMLVESAVLALILLGVARLQGWLFYSWTSAALVPGEILLQLGGFVRQLVIYFGAGIYEELLFRLMLLPAVAAAARAAGVSRTGSMVIAVVATSLLFSAAHYQLFASAGDEFDWFSFLFRFLAGVFFAILFLLRGFGIAAGTHTLYDVLVGVV